MPYSASDSLDETSNEGCLAHGVLNIDVVVNKNFKERDENLSMDIIWEKE